MTETKIETSVKEAHAYTPGLKVKKRVKTLKTRLLPIPGEVFVKTGDTVDYETIIARASVPGTPTIIKACQLLNVNAEDLPAFMLKKVGEKVEKGEIIAKYSPFWGLINRTVTCPVTGVIESISDDTGQVIVREPPIPVDKKAYIPGKITEVIPQLGVVIETDGAYIQGIFGLGGEKHGKLSLVVNSPDDILTEKEILQEHKGKIIVGGSMVSLNALKKALELGVNGIIVGGINGITINEFLGYEIGVAITGQEDINLTIIITEGFGKMAMSRSDFDILKEFDGYDAAINGTTQIRAGVIRPEIIIPHKKFSLESGKYIFEGGMRVGTLVRIIREPYFGKIGIVSNLPVQLYTVESGSSVRVVEVNVEGENIIVPRANVEIIEE